MPPKGRGRNSKASKKQHGYSSEFRTSLKIEELDSLDSPEPTNIVFVRSCYVCRQMRSQTGPLLSCEICSELFHLSCLPKRQYPLSAPKSERTLCSDCDMLTFLDWKKAETEQISQFDITAFESPSFTSRIDVPSEVEQVCRATVQNSHEGAEDTRSFLEYEESSEEEESSGESQYITDSSSSGESSHSEYYDETAFIQEMGEESSDETGDDDSIYRAAICGRKVSVAVAATQFHLQHHREIDDDDDDPETIRE
eukprot:jgi/Bigna1/126701/aug1.3_g1409